MTSRDLTFNALENNKGDIIWKPIVSTGIINLLK